MNGRSVAAFCAALGTLVLGATLAVPERVAAQEGAPCAAMPTETQVRTWLQRAPSHGGDAGGLFGGTRMWAAVVNRNGEVCLAVASTSDPTQVWPASLAIAKAKAYTANALSLDVLPLSTAMLYTFTQPGHSLWSLGQSNLYNPDLLQQPGRPVTNDQNKIAGGLIFFGGGVPLYRAGRIIGGLGISGDTSCTDHEIAKRVRDIGALNPPGGALADDIVYTSSVFNHPLCPNTWKNGVKVGEESPALHR